MLHQAILLLSALALLQVDASNLMAAAPKRVVMNEPLYMDGVSSITAIQAPSGATMVYYQAADTSIHELSGTGSPVTGGQYTDSLILAAGQARNNTPLAAATWTTDFSEIRLYYTSNSDGYCSGATHLRELVGSSGGSWSTGGLDALGYCTAPSSQPLYVTLPGDWKSDGLRVGFSCESGPLCEALWQDSKGWAWAEY
ncbi:hypothetical protein MMC08_004759 [Hypocenomyce scalaris]|nr:hypothetical protein [Hypocenomyce scalaris]